MTEDIGIAYPLADTSLPVVMIRRSVYASAVLAVCILVAEWIAGGFPLEVVPIGVFVLAAMAVTINLGLRQLKGKPIIIAPSSIVYYSWFSRLEVPWQDVDSVVVERYEPKSRVARGFVALTVGRQGFAPYVRVRLGRARSVGFIPSIRAIALYPTEPERFVQDAQQYLTPVTG